MLTASRNRRDNATQLQKQLLLATGRRLSSQTVPNRLHQGDLYASRPVICNPLTSRQRAEEDGLLNIEIKSNMIGAKCCLRVSPDSVSSVILDVFWGWSEKGIQNDPTFVRERSQYRRTGWMVRGGISIGGHKDLYIIWNGTLTVRRYAKEIPRPPCYNLNCWRLLCFSHVNARPHAARLVEN